MSSLMFLLYVELLFRACHTPFGRRASITQRSVIDNFLGCFLGLRPQAIQSSLHAHSASLVSLSEELTRGVACAYFCEGYGVRVLLLPQARLLPPPSLDNPLILLRLQVLLRTRLLPLVSSLYVFSHGSARLPVGLLRRHRLHRIPLHLSRTCIFSSFRLPMWRVPKHFSTLTALS